MQPSQSDDGGAAEGVRGARLRGALRTVTVAWMFGVVWLVSASGSHFKAFAEMLGFGNFAFGVLVALPFLATFGQLIAALLIERTGRLKRQFICCGVIHRLLWLAVAAVPLVLPVPSRLAVMVTLVILAASWFFQALGIPAWMTWMGAMVPRRIRGRYFAFRERLAVVVQIAVVVAFGVVVDQVQTPAGVAAARPAAVWAISAILATGAVFGMIDILLFRKVPEVLPKGEAASRPARTRRGGAQGSRGRPAGTPARTPRGPAAILEFLFGPLRDRGFRSYVLYGTTMTFSMTVGGWFFWLNAIDSLGFSNLAANALFLIVSPVAGIWTVRRWGRAIDRWGRRPVLVISTAGACVSLIIWLLISPNMTAPAFATRGLVRLASWLGGAVGRGDWAQALARAPVGAYLLAVLASMLGGATWSGINLAQTGIILGFADGSGRSRYVAASSVIISIGGVAGGFVGGAIATALAGLQTDPIRLGPLLWNNWHVTFAVALLARLMTIFWLARMPDPGAATVRSLARYMGTNVYHGTVTRLFYSLRVFGWQQPVKTADRPRRRR